MRFYYQSIFSYMFLALLYTLAIGLWWLIWTRVFRRKFSVPITWSVIAIVLAAPWVEEIWIAYRFGQLCSKDAGIFVYKTVEVEGFYDSTARSAFENLTLTEYKFMEQDSQEGRAIEHVERADDSAVAMVARFADTQNANKHARKHSSVTMQLSETERLVLFTTSGQAWRLTRLVHPTARFQYEIVNEHTPVAHKTEKMERVVVDNSTRELLGRETTYLRDAPWFFIALDRPSMLCPAPGEHPLQKYSPVFNLALKPLQRQ